MSTNRPNIYKKVTALLSIAILTFAFAIAGTAFAIGNHMPGQAGEHDPLTSALFNATGQIQSDQATAIMDNVNGNNIISRDRLFRLFSDTGGGNTFSLSQRTWRMVAADNNSITFWSGQAYRASNFRTQNNQANSHQYNQSHVRTNMLADFDNLVSDWSTEVLGANILPLGTSNHYGVSTDRIWLPSIGNLTFLTAAEGASWFQNDTQRRFNANGFGNSAWLRTPASAFMSIPHPGNTELRRASWSWRCAVCQRISPNQNVPNRYTSFGVGQITTGGNMMRGVRYELCSGGTGCQRWMRHNEHIMGASNVLSSSPGSAASVWGNRAAEVQTVSNLGHVNAISPGGAGVSQSMAVVPALRLSRQAVEDGMGNNVTFDANGGTPTPEPQHVQVNGTATEPSVTRPGYIFDHWSLQATPTVPFVFTTPITEPITLVAQWTARTGNVSFSLNGGTGTPPASFTATTGGTWPASITVPANIARIGHILLGFYTAPTDGERVFNRYGGLDPDPPAIVMPAGGLTLYAMWVPIGGAGGGFGLAELVAEAHSRNFTLANFGNNEVYWVEFNVALRNAETARHYLHTLNPGQVASIAYTLRVTMERAS